MVVSEVHYRPPDVFRYLVNFDNDNDEFVELQNLANSPVQLFDAARPTNIWRLRDAISFRFPSGVTIPAGGFLLVVGFDPSDVARLESFRTRFGVPSNVPVLGPWSGKLDNSSGRVELVMPAPPLTNPENLGIVTEVIVDRARYSDDTDPRVSTADGLGASLHRSPADSFEGWTGNWIAAAPSPGVASSAGNSPLIASQPEDLTLVATNVPAVFRVTMSGAGPFRYQWSYNGAVIPGAESDQLTIPNVQPPDAGIYQVIASGSGGSVESRLARLVVIPPLQIVREPVHTGVQPGRTNTVTVGAAGAGSISYQWYLDGSAIPGATNAALKIGDRPGGAQLSEDGLYHVVVTDSVSSVFTPPVRVAILVNPSITVAPQPQTVIKGGSAVLSVVVSNTVTLPLGYRWRRGTQTVQFQSLNSRVSFFVLTNVLSDTNVSVQITNLANRTGLISPVAQIRVVADSDGDGIPDEFEALHPGKLNANDPADGDQDADGDTMSNKAEYIAGTNPTDPQSYLRVSGVNPEPVTLTFRAEANRTYAVQYTDELGSGLWTTLQGIPSRPDARVETVTDPSPGASRLYRLLTPFQ
ncbi:MAG: hypothetical protein FJ405_05020 [Verrucomicrobia bacterium]|nr:hypothetical protein [Verrucomicrobiota bacterium]